MRRWGPPTPDVVEALAACGVAVVDGAEVLAAIDFTMGCRRVYVRPPGAPRHSGYALQIVTPGPARPRARRGEEE